jgi:hypothetical protein
MKKIFSFLIAWLLVTFLVVGSLFAFAGVVYAFDPDTDLSNADASFWGEDAGDYSGYSVASAGDVNGDGRDDFLVGAVYDEDGGYRAGQTYLILGRAAADWGMDFDLSNADASFWGEDADDWSGISVASAGDVNGDGRDDFLIGAYGDEDGGSAAGQTYLILGSAAADWGMDFDLSNADASFWGEDSDDYSGYSVASAGDVNGDGGDDFLIGAIYDEDGGNVAGQTYLWLGTPPVQYDLTINSTAGGNITNPGEGTFTYDEGTVVNLTAEAEEGYQFGNWTGDVDTIADVEAASTNITMSGNYSITANFEEEELPTVTTQAATSITTNSTTLNMIYTVGDFNPVEVRFAYKKSADTTWSYTSWVPKSASGSHAASLSGLSSVTTYNFKGQLKYDDTVIEGSTRQFTTKTPSTQPLPIPSVCFIATAAYGTPTAEEIDVLREFRDVVLLRSTVGAQFVALYYQLSPPVADFIASNELLKTLVRELLVDPIVWVVEATGDMWRN